METAKYFIIETRDLLPEGSRDDSFWSWDELSRANNPTDAQNLFEQAQYKYNTLRLVQVEHKILRLYKSVSPKVLDELESSLSAVEGNIREHIIEFLKSVDLHDYPCNIRLAGGYVITELILDYDRELVEVVFTGPDGTSDTDELSEFSTKEQLTILKEITQNQVAL